MGKGEQPCSASGCKHFKLPKTLSETYPETMFHIVWAFLSEVKVTHKIHPFCCGGERRERRGSEETR